MKEQSITKGFAVLSAASLIVKILSLLYIPFLLSVIGEEGNGIYAAAYQVYVFVYVLTNSGTPVAISKLVSELIALKNYADAVRSFKIARFILIISGTAMSLIMFFSAKYLSHALHFEKSYWAILALSPTILFTSVASAYRGYFQGRGNMVPTAVSQVIEQIVNTILTLVFAVLLLRYGLEAACAGGTVGTSLGALVSAIFLIIVYKNTKKPRAIANSEKIEIKRYTYKELVKKIIAYGIPITLCVGLQYAGNLVDLWNTKGRLLAAGFSDAMATQMYGYLYKYQQLMNAPISVIAALAATVLPAISGAMALKNNEQAGKKISYAFRLCFLVVMPSAVGFAVLSDPIFKLLKYGEGSYLMFYGSFVLVLLSVIQIQTTVLQGSNRLYTATIHLLLGIIAKITVNYFLISIPRLNILGAIAGSITGYSIPAVLNTFAIRNSLKLRFNLFGQALKPTLASTLMGFMVYFSYKYSYLLLSFTVKGYICNAFAVSLSIFIGALSYLFGLILLRGITRADLNSMPASIVGIIPRMFIKMIK